MAVPTRLALSKKNIPNEELFEVKLKHYLSRGLQGPDKTSAWELHKQIYHPRIVLGSQVLPEDHPLKREAWVVSDAFEAVSNGMENPGALMQLSFIGEHSPFFYWRLWIFALGKFYHDQPTEALDLLKLIPKESPLTPAVRVLTQLCSGQPGPGDQDFNRFAAEVMTRDDRVFCFFEEILDGIDTGMEDLFHSGALSLLDFLAETQSSLAPSAALWLISQVDQQEFTPDPLVQGLKALFGVKESCRLLALGLLPSDPEGALLYWMQYLVAGWEESHDKDWEDCCLGILADLVAGVLFLQKDQGEDPDFVRSFSLILQRFPRELKQEQIPWQSWEDCKYQEKPPSQPKAAMPLQKPSAGPMQLDLFAC